jgi:LysM repeat protein
VLGAVAGAVAGHKLQDGVSDWKDNRDEEKEKKKREEEEEKKREEERKKKEEDDKKRREEDKKREEDDKRRREEDDKRRREEDNKRREEPQHQSNRHHAAPPQHHQSQPRGVSYAGNFSASSRDIRLDAHGEFMLHASCGRRDGSYQNSSLSLNKVIENDQGSFRWASGSRGSGSSQPSSVTVQPGDTLRNIAARVNCSFDEIARHNGLQNPDLIHPGQVLQLPNGGGGGGGGGGVGNFGSSARDVRLADGGRRLEGELLRDGRWVGSSIVLDERIGNDNGTLRLV